MAVDVVISVLGLVLVGFVLHSAVKTTLTLHSSDFLTHFVNETVWRLALLLHRATGSRRYVRGAGVVCLLSVIAVWTLLYWLGWLLFFLPEPEAVVAAESSLPADFWSRVYFVGYSLITLGIGDYVPGTPVYQVATILASASGFFLITLSITYLVPVVTSLVDARHLAVQLFLAGDTPSRIANTMLQEPERFRELARDAPSQVILLTQRYFAYPVLHYFPSATRDTSIALALVSLDEALSQVLELGGERSKALEPLLITLRGAMDEHLRFLDGSFLSPADDTPPAPAAGDWSDLDQRLEDSDLAVPFDRLADRRRLLHAMVRHDVREWSDVYRS